MTDEERRAAERVAKMDEAELSARQQDAVNQAADRTMTPTPGGAAARAAAAHDLRAYLLAHQRRGGVVDPMDFAGLAMEAEAFTNVAVTDADENPATSSVGDPTQLGYLRWSEVSLPLPGDPAAR